MGLREEAERDLGLILEDRSFGFAWNIVIVSPENQAFDMLGFSQDIATAIDPETGLMISGRTASVAFRRASLLAQGIDPIGIADLNKKPWKVIFADIHGEQHIFKIVSSNPDRMIGCVTYKLGAFDVI